MLGAIFVAIIGLGAGPAAAAIDISGQWHAQFTVPTPNGSPPFQFPCQWAVTQGVGGALTITESGCTASDLGIVGTIDVSTGAMSLTGTASTATFCPTMLATGTANAFGSSFQLSFHCVGGPGVFDAGTIAGSGRCGNGTIDPGEQCEDGPTNPACCDANCQLAGSGTPCYGDAESCTFEKCDASGACLPAGLAPDGSECTDSNICTVGEACAAGVCGNGTPEPAGSQCFISTGNCAVPACDGAGTCVAVPFAAGTSCEVDDNFCTVDACDGAGTCAMGACSPCCDANAGCVVSPATNCSTAVDSNSSRLMITSGSKAKFAWKMSQGEAVALADLGDPTNSTDYAVCVYEKSYLPQPNLLMASVAPAGGDCDGTPCWRTTASGFAYRDRLLTPSGFGKLSIKAGSSAGKTKLMTAGGGPLLNPRFSRFASSTTVIAQLRFGGQCIQNRFLVPKVGLKRDGFVLKDNGGSPSGAFTDAD